MFIIWQKGNKLLGSIYAIITTMCGFGLIQMLLSGETSDLLYGFIGTGFFALLSWYCFRPVPKGRWTVLEDGRRAFIEKPPKRTTA